MATIADWENFRDFWDYSSESAIWNSDFSCGQTWTDGGGHAVLCVGYNDEPGTNNDYWIMLNSWGTTSGRPNGLFRLDMHIDYDCSYYLWDTNYDSLYWQTLNVDFGPGGGNKSPNTPSTPSGPGRREVGESGTYSTHATDPDGDQVQYNFSWGDGTTSSWTSLGASGHTDSLSHSWSSPGTYYVRAQARDEHGKTSIYWSTSKAVYVPGGGEDNDPPYKPAKPSGPSSGQTWKSYTYSTSTTDPDGDNVYYQWDWGGFYSFWLGPYNSGGKCEAKHSWIIEGSRQIRVKAIDDPNGDGNISDGTESEWSDPLIVTMPKNRQLINPPFLQFFRRFMKLAVFVVLLSF
jgi:hypothetical protein